jgi:hypothetical protein
MPVDFNEITTKLKNISDNTTYILQTPHNNISPKIKNELTNLNTQANNALVDLLSFQNNNNTQISDTYVKAMQANTFINEAKTLLKRIEYENKNKLQNLRTTNTTQLKQIQFNNYFSQKYSYNVKIMKILVITSILLMICILLHTRDIIPDFLYTILLSVIISISIIIIITMLISEMQRSKTNFNAFNWTNQKSQT